MSQKYLFGSPELEAALILGVLALVVGALLYLPFYFWIRWRKKKSAGHGQLATRVTAAGFAVYGFMVVLLFAGYALGVLAPQTAFGQFMSTEKGKLIYTALVAAGSIVIEKFLAARGHKLVRKQDDH